MMNNIDKLLRAFIEAQGFEVKDLYATGQDTRTAYVVDYKVTKKEDFVPLPVQSKEWGCIVEYITDHYEDIEIGIDDYGTLKPILEFISRRS